MATNDNVTILDRIRGVAAQPSTPETDADPRNPNARPIKRPAFVQPGEIAWRSYTAGACENTTVVMVMTAGGGAQHLFNFDWRDFHRDDAEALADFICRAMNALPA